MALANHPDLDKLDELLGDDNHLAYMGQRQSPNGDGKASDRIARAVAWKSGLGSKPPSFDFVAEEAPWK
jgi:UDP-N-acetylglucosamine 2-epimerase